MIRTVLVIAVGLLLGRPARADLPPSLPKTEYVKLTHRIEAQHEYPDFAFVVYRDGRFGREAEYVELTPNRPLELKGGYREQAILFICPKATASRFKNPMALAEAAIRGQLPEVVREEFEFTEVAPSWTGRNVTVAHQLRRNASGSGLELVRPRRYPMFQWYAVAVSLALGLLLSGLWLVRRLRRKVRPA